MKNSKSDFLLNEADQLLKKPNDQRSRSEEDGASYMVCQNSRKALKNSLIYFLFKNGIEPEEPVTIQHLMNQCRAEDARFDNVEIKNILCRHDKDDEEYCLSVGKVSGCFDSARLIRNLVDNPVPGY
jgi:hypothetical protein